MSGKRVFYTASTSLVVVGILAGFLFLGNVMAYGKTIYNQLGVFSQVLGHISDNYVDEVDGEELIDGAITGMLEGLDPHSNYLDAERFGRMQERNRGTYYGIGVSFDIVDDKLTVISPIEGSPSYRLGIRAGDVIAMIEGESAKGITREEVFDKLRGPRGTSVHISVQREGHEDLLEFDIVRDEIPILSVPYQFMLTENVGYVRMNRFSATTSDELAQAVEDLRRQGMEQMILDLRGNSGGYLNEAIEVSDMFLTGGKRIVYTRGRLPDASEDYYTTGRGRFLDEPLIVMVDHGSASASEIVSGALQDWDRALILGQSTFGKGLVQRQYRLKNGAALLLTVARYYTPSGRLIQRDYSDRDAYLSAGTFEELEAGHADAVVDSTRERFRTAGNRTVLGGGGIFPDIEINVAYPSSETTTQLSADRAFFDFAPLYISRKNLDKQTLPFDQFRREFRMTDQDLQSFESFLTDRELAFSPDSLQVHRELVERSMQAEIARTLWGEPQRYQILIEADPELQEAMSYLPQARLMARSVVDGEPGPLGDQN